MNNIKLLAPWIKKKVSSACTKKNLYRKIPIFSWLPKYNSSYAIGDLVAGITVGLTLIPQVSIQTILTMLTYTEDKTIWNTPLIIIIIRIMNQQTKYNFGALWMIKVADTFIFRRGIIKSKFKLYFS